MNPGTKNDIYVYTHAATMFFARPLGKSPRQQKKRKIIFFLPKNICCTFPLTVTRPPNLKMLCRPRCCKGQELFYALGTKCSCLSSWLHFPLHFSPIPAAGKRTSKNYLFPRRPNSYTYAGVRERKRRKRRREGKKTRKKNRHKQRCTYLLPRICCYFMLFYIVALTFSFFQWLVFCTHVSLPYSTDSLCAYTHSVSPSHTHKHTLLFLLFFLVLIIEVFPSPFFDHLYTLNNRCIAFKGLHQFY